MGRRHRCVCIRAVAQVGDVERQDAANAIQGVNFDAISSAIRSVRERAGDRPVSVALFPGELGIRPGDLPLEGREIEVLKGDEWEVVRNDSSALILERCVRSKSCRVTGKG